MDCTHASSSGDNFLDVGNAAQPSTTPANSNGGHRIYVKTEPAGSVVFGELTGTHLESWNESLRARKLSEELLGIISDPPEERFRRAEGVSSACDRGNEGTPHLLSPIAVPQDENGCMIEGVYMACMSLSKVSIEFEFVPSDGAVYDASKLVELTVPIELPGCVECQRYGEPEFGLVTGYKYAGQVLDEYDGDLCDRGYDTTITIFRVCGGDCELLLRRCINEDGEVEESWS